MDARPNHTVYINNLNEKVKKEGKLSHFYTRIIAYNGHLITAILWSVDFFEIL